MKRLFLFAFVLGFGSVALAEDAAPADAPIDLTKEGPLTRLPPKKADTKGIDALYKSYADAHKAADVNAAAALVDFPAYWQTDGAAGHKAEMLEKDAWVKEMTTWFTTLPKDTKLTMKRKITWLSADMATVAEENSIVAGKLKGKWTSVSTVIKKDGKWLFKTFAEAGWVPAAPAAQ